MFVDITALLYIIYNNNITKAKKGKKILVGKGGHSLHFRSKGTLKFVLTYIICSVFLSKTYRKKLISTLYFFKKATDFF